MRALRIITAAPWVPRCTTSYFTQTFITMGILARRKQIERVINKYRRLFLDIGIILYHMYCQHNCYPSGHTKRVCPTCKVRWHPPLNMCPQCLYALYIHSHQAVFQLDRVTDFVDPHCTFFFVLLCYFFRHTEGWLPTRCSILNFSVRNYIISVTTLHSRRNKHSEIN